MPPCSVSSSEEWEEQSKLRPDGCEKEVKTEHLVQHLSIRKKERDYGEEVAGDRKGFQVFSFCRMTKSNLGRKVFISFSISRPQFLFGGSQEETHSRNLESGTMEECCLLPCSQAHIQLLFLYILEPTVTDSATHSGQDSPALIINRDEVPSRQSDGGGFLS